MGLQETLAGLFGKSAVGSAPTLASAVVELLAGQGGGGQGAGGLNGLVERFRSAGLGDIVQSWIGTGANQSIGADTLHNVLGDEHVNALAAKTGLPIDQLLTQLSQHLPGIIDKLTPDGQLPESGLLQATLAKFSQRVG